jgi:hypothetical protein
MTTPMDTTRRHGTSDTLQRLLEGAKELQWTAMSANVGAVTVSDEGRELDRQLAAVMKAGRSRDRMKLRVHTLACENSGSRGKPATTSDDSILGPSREDRSDAAAGQCVEDLHEELAKSRMILEHVQSRPLLQEAVFADESRTGQNLEKRALKAAITDRDRLVIDLTKKAVMARELEAQLLVMRQERCHLMERNRELADIKCRMERDQARNGGSHGKSASASETRRAIKLQIKKNIILRNVMASLV